MKRRNFLRTAGLSAALTPFVHKGFSFTPYSKLGFLPALTGANLNGNILVLIQMGGGNDGLNTIIPLDQYDRLDNHRSNVLIPENKVLNLDGTFATGFHPSMTGLQEMYNDGLVNIVQNVGYPNQDYSHFRSTDIWMSASDSEEYLESGWLGRYLQGEFPDFPTGFPNAEMPDPLAIQIGSIVSTALLGPVVPMGMTITDPTSFYEFVNDVVEAAPDTPYGHELEFIRLVSQQAQQYYESIKAAAENGTNVSSEYPPMYENELADQLKIVANLISGGCKTPVYLVSIHGFDTHSLQVDEAQGTEYGAHAYLLSQLSQAIHAFQDDLKMQGLDGKVAGMTFSEFGRTIGSNASLGTDHGAAAPMICFGKNVIPGIIGENPYIPQSIFDSQDLPMTHDYRQVYASALQDWLGLSNWTQVLNDTFDILPIFKATTPTHETAGRDAFAVGNFPNPVRTTTHISFTSIGANVVIELLDVNGRYVQKIAEGQFTAGRHTVRFDRSALFSGTYFYRVKMNGLSVTKKMLVL